MKKSKALIKKSQTVKKPKSSTRVLTAEGLRRRLLQKKEKVSK